MSMFTFRPKIRVWQSKEQNTLHVFLGDIPSSVQPILKQLEKKEALTSEQEKALATLYGVDYVNTLAIGEKSPVKYHKQAFYNDDSVNMFRKKLCHFLKLSSPNDMYIWYDRDVTHDASALYTFIQHVFRRDARIPYATFQKYVHRYFGVVLKSHTHNLVEKQEAVRILLQQKLRTVAESLCFRYMYDRYVEYIPFHPYKLTEDIDVSSFSIQNTLSMLMQNFAAVNDEYHVCEKKHGISTMYFPLGVSNPLLEADVHFIDTVQKSEKDILTSELPDTITKHTLVNYLHIKGNDTLVNRKANMEELFKALDANGECPLIKLKLPTNVFFKIHKDSLPKITQETLDTWTTVSVTKDDRSYIMCKLSFFDRSHCTFTIYEDLSYQVKFNFSVKDKEKVEDVSTFLNKTINQYLDKLQACYPNAFIQKIPDQLLYESKEYDNVRVSQIILTTSVTSPSEIKYSNFAQVIRQHFFTYFNIIENKDPSIIHLQYKKVNNYTKVNNMSSFIYQNLSLDHDEQIKQLMFSFMISKEEAEKELESWKIKHAVELQENQDKVFLKMKYDSFVNVKIRLNNPFELKYLVNGLTDLAMLEKIQFLVSHMLVMSSKKKKQGKEDLVELVEHMDEKEQEEASKGNMTFKDIDGELKDLLGEDVDFDLGDLDIAAAIDDFALDDDLLALEQEFAAKPSEPEQSQSGKQSELPTPAPTKSSKTKGYILGKLHEADRDLFDYKLEPKDDGKRRREYSSLCGWVDRRQPVVVNKEEIDKIEKEHPKAIHGYVKTGSTAEYEEKNFYICPSVWCPKSRVALSIEEYQKADRKCPMDDEEPIEYSSKSFWGEGDKGLERAHYPGFLDKFTHPKQYCLPCCFKKEAKEGNRNKQRKDMCITNKKKEQEQAVEPEEMIGNEKYIKGEHYFPLENNRFGMLPSELVKYFGFTHHGNRHDGTGLMTEETKCLLRRGIRQSEQSYLECMVHVLDNPAIKTVSDLVAAIDQHLDMVTFLSLENGRVMKMFVNPNKSIYQKADFQEFKAWFQQQKKYIQLLALEDVMKALDDMDTYKADMMFGPEILREFMLYQSYMNYKKYVRDMDVVKRHELMMDAIVNHHHAIINQDRVNVMVLEVNLVTGKAFVDCYVNKNASSVADIQKPFVFILKRGVYYEPIYFTTNVKNNLVMTCKNVYSQSSMEIKKLIDFYLLNCTDSTSKVSNENMLLHLSNEGFKPKYIVIDYGYKACGAILQGNIYVPFIDRDNIFFAKHVRYIYLHEVPNFKCFKKEEDVRKVYTLARKYTKSTFYDIHDVHREGDKLVGLHIDNGQVYVPLRLSQDAKERMYFRHGLFLLLGEEKSDRRTDLLNRLYQDHDTLHMMDELIRDYLEKNDGVKREVEFLQDELNPFPEHFKRQKLLQIIQPIVSQVAWDDSKLQKMADLLMGRTKSLSSYIKQRIRRYSVTEAEVLMDYSDIKRGKLADLKARVENPYQYLLSQVHQLSESYVFEKDDSVTPLPPIFTESSTYKDLPVKFRKVLKGYQVLDAEETYAPGYALNAFLHAAKLISEKNAITEDLFKATLQKEIVQMYEAGNVDDILENPWLKEWIRKEYGKMMKVPLSHILQGLDNMNYYPSVLDLRIMARLAKVNIVISGRKTKKNPDAIEVIDHGSPYYMIILFSYDRHKILDRFELFVKDQQFLFDVKDLGTEFIGILEKKKHVFEVDIVDDA